MIHVILSTITGINHTSMHIQFLHTLSLRQNSRRQHLAPWRWCGGSPHPGEECNADCEAFRVILSTITGITIQACMCSFCTR